MNDLLTTPFMPSEVASTRRCVLENRSLIRPIVFHEINLRIRDATSRSVFDVLGNGRPFI